MHTLKINVYDNFLVEIFCRFKFIYYLCKRKTNNN